MDTTFNVRRFGKLLCNEFHLKYKRALLMIGILSGIVVIYFGIFAIEQSLAYMAPTFSFFAAIIFVFQGLITNIHFSELSSKSQILSFFLLPASKLEKFTAKSLCCLVIFPILFTLYFGVVLKLNTAYNIWASSVFNLPFRAESDLMFLDNLLSNKENVLIILISIWIFAANSFITGVQFFKKWSAVKIFMIYIGLLFFMTYLTKFFYVVVSGNTSGAVFPFLIIEERGVGMYTPVDDFPYYIPCLFTAIGLYLLVVSWFKFNEKTV